jgi:hypothetical protein
MSYYTSSHKIRRRTMNTKQSNMETLTVWEGIPFSFAGLDYVWNGDSILETTRNNKYHIRSSIKIGSNGFCHGVLYANGKAVKLVMEKSPSPPPKPAPQAPIYTLPLGNSDSESDSESDDEMPPLPKPAFPSHIYTLPLGNSDSESDDEMPPLPARSISVLSNMTINKSVNIGNVNIVGQSFVFKSK